jgi:hypothetical protein
MLPRRSKQGRQTKANKAFLKSQLDAKSTSEHQRENSSARQKLRMLKKSLTLEGGKCGVFSNGKRRISSIIEPPPARLEHSALDHGRLCEEKKS